MTQSASPGDEKITGIELIRFACALAVLVFHYQHFGFRGTSQADFVSTAQPFYPWLQFLYRNGFYGVEVFWCISGFIFFWKYGRRIPLGKVSGYRFFVLRFSRLYPLHFATLLFVALLQMIYFAHNGDYFVYHYNDLYHFVLQLFLASNWGLQSGDSFNGPIWSISVEVLVYAVFFLSLRYISSSVLFIAAMAIGAAAVQLSHLSVHPVFSCIMYFYLGCLTAIGYEQASRSRTRTAIATAIATAALLAVMTVGILDLHVAAKTTLVVLAPSLIYLCVCHMPSAPWTTRLLVPAGNMTYSSYLLHVPIQITVVTVCSYFGVSVPLYHPAFFVAFFAVTLFLSYWSYRLLEMPAQDLLRRHMIRKPAAAVALQQASPS